MAMVSFGWTVTTRTCARFVSVSAGTPAATTYAGAFPLGEKSATLGFSLPECAAPSRSQPMAVIVRARRTTAARATRIRELRPEVRSAEGRSDDLRERNRLEIHARRRLRHDDGMPGIEQVELLDARHRRDRLITDAGR